MQDDVKNTTLCIKYTADRRSSGTFVLSSMQACHVGVTNPNLDSETPKLCWNIKLMTAKQY